MTNDYKLNIAWLYPDLMSTYGDRGNIIVLQKRCQWRGIGVKINSITLETEVSKLKTSNLIFMGGAQDRQQKLVSDDFLKQKAPLIKEMVEKNIPSLFVCAAYQAVGHYYRPSAGVDIPGASILDLNTVHPGENSKRLIGNIVAKLINPKQLQGQIIVGFENHGGRTKLGKNLQPLAKVVSGYGNDGKDGYEGAVYKNAIGSYFHGPILTKNPILADWLITRALEVKYNKLIELEPLDDKLSDLAKKDIIKKI